MPQYGVDFAGGRIREGKTYKLWEHQEQAIEQWEENDRVGILSMATGSGKTLTALAAASRCVDLNLLLIAAPRKNLVDQWKEEVERFTTFLSRFLFIKMPHRGKIGSSANSVLVIAVDGPSLSC